MAPPVLGSLGYLNPSDFIGSPKFRMLIWTLFFPNLLVDVITTWSKLSTQTGVSLEYRRTQGYDMRFATPFSFFSWSKFYSTQTVNLCKTCVGLAGTHTSFFFWIRAIVLSSKNNWANELAKTNTASKLMTDRPWQDAQNIFFMKKIV